MSGTSDDLKESKKHTAISNQLKFDSELVEIASKAIKALFSRSGHHCEKWLGFKIDKKYAGRLKLKRKTDELTLQQYKKFELKNWLILCSDLLENVEKVATIMSEAATECDSELGAPRLVSFLRLPLFIITVCEIKLKKSY